MTSPSFHRLFPFCQWLLLASTAMVYAQGNSGQNSLSSPPRLLTKSIPGFYVNSRFDETKPMISPDGKVLYFARKNAPGNLGGKGDPQDIYFSQTQDGINWTAARNAGPDVNSRFADNLCAIENGGGCVMFVPQGKQKGNFVRRGKNFNQSSNSMVGPDVENESPYLEATFSNDRGVLLYTAKTKKNLLYRKEVDERDIYLSRKVGDHWSEPVNLGAVINSISDEYSPFLAADQKTLYFATDGRGGFGGADIFMSRRLDDTWTNWSEPVNLGPEINSNTFDGYLTVSAVSGIAYFVTHNKAIGKGDINSIYLSEAFAPARMMVWKARAKNATTSVPLGANVILQDEHGKILAKGVTDALTGDIEMILSPRQTFSVTATVNNFKTLRKTIWAGQQSTDLLELIPESREAEITLRPILFEKGTDRSVQSSKSTLDSLIQILKLYPDSEVVLLGHTDNNGSFSDLKVLSEKRVTVIREYLVQKGISRGRIIGNGYGASKPSVPNDCEANRMKNRRVEVVVKISH